MPISLEWSSTDKTILIMTYTTPWTWQEFETAYNKLSEKLNSLTNRCDLIIDIQRGGLPPQGAMLRFKKVAELKHPCAGEVIFVGPRLLTQMVNSIVNVLKSAFWNHEQHPEFQFVPTLEAALVLCRENQMSMPEQYGVACRQIKPSA